MEDEWKLIYYHEDRRYELYNIVSDVGEQTDLVARESTRAEEMKKRLQRWLDSTPAKFPSKDPQFDSAKREARWEMLRTTGKQRLERQHAGFLREDFKPNKNWWGSKVEE